MSDCTGTPCTRGGWIASTSRSPRARSPCRTSMSERLRRDPTSLTDADLLTIARAPLVAPGFCRAKSKLCWPRTASTCRPVTRAAGPWPWRSPVRRSRRPGSSGPGRRGARRSAPRPCRRPSGSPRPRKHRSSPIRSDACRPCSSDGSATSGRARSRRTTRALYLRLFISRFGDLPAERVTPLMVSEFRDALLQVANNATASLRNVSLDALVAWSLKPENVARERLSRSTINAKAIGALSVVMKAGRTLGFVQSNPCSDQALEMRKGDVRKRKAYSLADLKLIFACGAFAPRPRITKGGCGPAAFWLPLLALFAGARLEELGQLLVADVRCRDGGRLPDRDGSARRGGDHR